MSRRLTCHRCASDRLTLIEVCHEIATYDDGIVVDGSTLHPVGEGTSAAGDIQPSLTMIECQKCEHRWRPRRAVGERWENVPRPERLEVASLHTEENP